MSKKTIFGCFTSLFLLILVSDACAEVRQQPGMHSALQQEFTAAGFNLEPLNLQWRLLERFYAKRDGRPVWHTNGRLNHFGNSLIKCISSARSEGLSPADYHQKILGYFPLYTIGKTQQLRELILTDVFLRLALDLRIGRFNPTDIDPQWRFSSESFDPVEFLETFLLEGSFAQLFDSLTPTAVDYDRLRDAYSRYLLIEKSGGWPEITVNYTLKPGAFDPVIELLRERLGIEGDHPDTEPDDLWHFDKQLQASVRRFQRRNGLFDDGIVGPLTRDALNVPVARRIKQLRANLERWRWLPRDLGDQHLLVNTAGNELTLVFDGEPVVRKRTITGRKKRQTPSFKSRITHLVVNPEWTVPRIIAVQDLLPKQQRDMEYLERKNIQVLQQQEGHWVQLDAKTIDWSQYHEDYFPFTLRQAPGPKNSLGRIKFHMDNPYAIYLHDTPAVGLFNKPIRAFSSGCVRVEEVDHLARYLLDSAGQPVEELIDLPLQSGETLISKLSTPIVVYLVYFTNWVDEAGRVQFRPDIYLRNTSLLLALQGSEESLTAFPRRVSSNTL